MKNPITVLALFILICFSSLQAQVTQEWVATYNGPGNTDDGGYAIAVGNSGNIYVTGNEDVIGGPGVAYATIKYNSSGIQQWVQRYTGPMNGENVCAGSIAVDDFENVYVTGGSESSSLDDDYATIKYNSLGDSLWVARYSGPGNYRDDAYSIAVDGSGNVYVTGSSNTTPLFRECATVKYNSSGVQQWAQRYSRGFGGDYGAKIAVDASGNVYVIVTSNGNGTSEYVTIKYNSSGQEQWVELYNGTGNSYDDAYSLAIDESGNVYVTGKSTGNNSDYDCATIKYNSSGTQQWVAIYNSGIGHDVGEAMTVDVSGNVYVTGASAGSGTGFDYLTIKYNSAGDLLWVSRYNGPGNGADVAQSLKVDASGNVYITGQSLRSGITNEYATVKYNSSGVQQWVQRYNAPANQDNSALSIALNGSGDVYVTGFSRNGANYDYATIKYSQLTGVQTISSEIPNQYSLSQNYPNPFNPVTVIRYSLIENRFVKLKVYDILGNEVATLVNEKQNAGSYSVDFDGSKLSSGIYFYKLQTDYFSEVKRMTLLK
jgi:uncharacterized delta-60 repeat protein